jgi:hypothetical protein
MKQFFDLNFVNYLLPKIVFKEIAIVAFVSYSV